MIHQAGVTFADADIQEIGNGSGVEIVPMPGAGRVLQVLTGYFTLDTSAGAYSGADPSSAFLLTYGNGVFGTELVPIETALETPGITSAYFYPIWQQNAIAGAGSFAGILTSNVANPASSLENLNLRINDWWAPGAYGSGDPANTLQVGVIFVVFDTVTGLYLTTTQSGWNQTTRTF